MIANGNISGKVGIYLRLSREDGDKVESDSIRNQRELLMNFIGKNKLMKYVGEYVDDGYSGTNYNRPNFQRMLGDAQKGRINCLLIKDLSRLGRNYIETGRYLERIFPSIGLRVIAVNDNYDSTDNSSDENQIIVPFKNLINDAYCRDISIKIRSHFDVKRRNGQFIGSFAGYGYMKDPSNKNKLVIDDYAAEVVLQIFNMRLSGMGPIHIAEKLDEMGVQPPYEYKRKCGLNFNSGFRSDESAKWSVETVIRILKNEMYTGTMVQGKSRKINYKVKKSMPIDKDDWITVEGTHDAIVSKEKFDAVQELMNLDTRTAPGKSIVYPLSGYVKCGTCGQNMIRRTTSKKGKKYYYFHCSTYKNGGECTSHLIRDTKVTDAVLNAIQKQIEVLDKIETVMAWVKDYPNELICIKTLDKQLAKLKEEIEYYGVLKAKLYKDMVDGIVTKEEYKELNNRFSASRDDAEKIYSKVSEKRASISSGEIRFQPWIDELKKYRNIKKLSRAVVIALIDKVVIVNAKEIEVHFLFEDEINELIKYTEEQSQKEVKEA